MLPRVLGAQDMSIGALLRRRLGPGVVARFADPLVGGIYGATVDELSIDAVLPVLRTHEAERRSLILASLAQGRSAPRPASPDSSPFRSMAAGMGSLVDGLVDGLRARGADLRTGVRAVGLEVVGTGTVVTLADGSRHEAAGVVLAGGAACSAGLLSEIAPAAAEALRAVPHGSTATVHLGFRADDFDPSCRARLPRGRSRAGADHRGHPLLRQVAGPCARGHGPGPCLRPQQGRCRLPAARRRVLDAVAAHVSQVLGARSAPFLRHLVRWRDAMPVYTVGHLDRVRAVAESLADTRKLRVAGSALHGVGVPDCLADGRKAGSELAAFVPARLSTT